MIIAIYDHNKRYILCLFDQSQLLTDNTTSGTTLRRWRLSNLNHDNSVGEMRGSK